MSKITRRKSPRFGASKSKNNPFENRGMDKFHEVYSELEKMRAAIAAQEGVSTADVWFTRGTSKGRDWIPVVVGKNQSSVSSQGGPFNRLQKNESLSGSWGIEEEKGAEAHQIPETEESQSERAISSSHSPHWYLVKGEHLALEMQQAARKAFKAVALFVMIAAAVADVLIAVAAGFASAFIAKHLRPLWARYLPLQFSRQQNQDLSFAFPLAACSLTPPVSCVSAPTSPRLHQLEQAASFETFNKVVSSFSTPASPVRNCPTYFSSERPQEHSESSNYRQQQPRQQQKHSSQTLNRQVQQQDEIRRDTTPVMLILLVILFTLSIGKVGAAVVASLAWFAYPVARKWSSSTPSRTGQQHNGLRQGHSV